MAQGSYIEACLLNEIDGGDHSEQAMGIYGS
jgi:hypothetical protein